MEMLRLTKWSYLKDFFIKIEPWLEKLQIKEGVSWIEVSGIPLHCWNYETCKRVAGLWGKLVSVDENFSKAHNYEKIKLLISISQLNFIDEVVNLVVDNAEVESEHVSKGFNMGVEVEADNGLDRAVKDVRAMGLGVVVDASGVSNVGGVKNGSRVGCRNTGTSVPEVLICPEVSNFRGQESEKNRDDFLESNLDLEEELNRMIFRRKKKRKD
ncbi:hypothetical protein J1N35_045180 [Gossypium stocksii]|uniref:DUF4283 domain-containing protein n=1 Tax=Gossypium stocksii TaxID=47602 RepID=A0A9D3ZGR3_9ROSI|nr:hypothetical protein J1N35_045180 [Gossypium stocksii]